MSEEIVEVRDLRIRVGSRNNRVHAVNGVSLSLEAGETLGVVGESGSGKSLLCRALMGLLPDGADMSGEILWNGKSIAMDSERTWQARRGPMVALIPQDPMTSLHPGLSIATQLTETLRAHERISKKAALDRAVAALEETGITAARERIHQWPHQFSGGMRQRVLIASALLLRPKVLIADEPATALDVTVQAKILHLLRDLQCKYKMALILVSHDLAVVAQVASRVHVMYGGRFVEAAKGASIFARPAHPYTRGLLNSLPEHLGCDEVAAGIPGQPPQFRTEPKGCVFFERCQVRAADAVEPSSQADWKEIEPGHFVEACGCCIK